jgi:hypothetical protein
MEATATMSDEQRCTQEQRGVAPLCSLCCTLRHAQGAVFVSWATVQLEQGSTGASKCVRSSPVPLLNPAGKTRQNRRKQAGTDRNRPNTTECLAEFPHPLGICAQDKHQVPPIPPPALSQSELEGLHSLPPRSGGGISSPRAPLNDILDAADLLPLLPPAVHFTRLRNRNNLQASSGGRWMQGLAPTTEEAPGGEHCA